MILIVGPALLFGSEPGTVIVTPVMLALAFVMFRFARLAGQQAAVPATDQAPDRQAAAQLTPTARQSLERRLRRGETIEDELLSAARESVRSARQLSRGRFWALDPAAKLAVGVFAVAMAGILGLGIVVAFAGGWRIVEGLAFDAAWVAGFCVTARHVRAVGARYDVLPAPDN